MVTVFVFVTFFFSLANVPSVEEYCSIDKSGMTLQPKTQTRKKEMNANKTVLKTYKKKEGKKHELHCVPLNPFIYRHSLSVISH